jgi:hypothetical protein
MGTWVDKEKEEEERVRMHVINECPIGQREGGNILLAHAAFVPYSNSLRNAICYLLLLACSLAHRRRRRGGENLF